MKAIKTGFFDSEQFPELKSELSKMTIEIIDKTGEVDKDASYLFKDKK